jgi:hypothetical protein
MAGASPGGGVDPPLARMPEGTKEQAMASDQIRPAFSPSDSRMSAKSKPSDGRRINRRRPVVVLVRSLAMAALAGLGILVVLPAVIAAQAASAL